MRNNQFVGEWKRSCNNVAQYFSAKYFGNSPEAWWVADEVGGVYYINDHFFNMNDMIDYIQYGYSKDHMFEYYQYALDKTEKKEIPINIKNWILLINKEK